MAGKRLEYTVTNLSNVDSENFYWYGVVTQINYEEAYVNRVLQQIDGVEELEKSLSEIFIPIQYTKQENGKVKKDKGAYKNYVFVKCKLTLRMWDIIRATTGAILVMMTDGMPAVISEEEIEKIKKQYQPVGFTSEEETKIQKDIKEKYIFWEGKYPFTNYTKVGEGIF